MMCRKMHCSNSSNQHDENRRRTSLPSFLCVLRACVSKIHQKGTQRSFGLLFLLMLSSTALSQNPSYEQKLYYTCKVWGFLKYYHSQVSNCLVSWDDVLLRTLPLIKASSTREEFNDAMDTLILAAGPMAAASVALPDTLPAERTRNRDFRWMDDQMLLPDIRTKLRYVRDNFRPHIVCTARNKNDTTLTTSSYLVFPGDDPCVDIDVSKTFPDESNRCLMLFKYWNIVNYFGLNLYLSDVPWDSTLIRHAARVARAGAYLDFYLEFKRISAALDDGHVNMLSNTYHPGWYQPKLILRFIHDGCYVFKSGYAEIHRGDRILSVDGKTIAQWEDSLRPLISAGNPDHFKAQVCFFMLRGMLGANMHLEYADSVGATHALDVGRYGHFTSSWFMEYSPSDSLGPVTWRKWGCNVGYVNMGRLQPEDVASMYDTLKDTKAIVFDVRNYPNNSMWELVNRMYPRKQCLAIFSEPDMNYPGTSYLEYSFSDSNDVQHPYGGKTIILCDQETVSHAEYTCMALQAIPGSVVVGSQTAGADGNITRVNLSQDMQTFFTTLGVYYPDGRQTQRIGIVPDSLVYPTPEGIRMGRDEVLEKALEIAGCPVPTGMDRSDFADRSSLSIIAYPNPFTSLITLTLSSVPSSTASLKVFDVLGREVLDATGRLGGGTSVVLHHRDLPSRGMYFVRLQDNTGIITTAIAR